MRDAKTVANKVTTLNVIILIAFKINTIHQAAPRHKVTTLNVIILITFEIDTIHQAMPRLQRV